MVNKKNKTIGQKKRLNWLYLTAFFSLTSAGIVFSILCLANAQLRFVVENYTLCLYLSIGLFCGLCAVAVALSLCCKDTAVKVLFSVYFFVLFCLVLTFILQKTGFFSLGGSSEGLQSYLEKTGVWMPIFYVLLQYLQVILLPIPSLVSTVAGVALFGAFRTMLYSLVGILLGSITAFFIGRKLGKRAVSWIVGEDTLQKWQKKLKGKDNLALTIMFVLPLFPDDILCFIAGLSSMSSRYFLCMIVCARGIGVAATCYSFDFIPWTTWWGMLIWGALICALVFAFIFIYKYMDKIQAFFKKRTKKPHK